ncbi:hypothetical protein B9Y61_09155 [Stenotrophomonas maltophilia]|nr:hypothetical protein B9Y61_09155 [Stenotrophomonas maltophilia]
MQWKVRMDQYQCLRLVLTLQFCEHFLERCISSRKRVPLNIVTTVEERVLECQWHHDLRATNLMTVIAVKQLIIAVRCRKEPFYLGQLVPNRKAACAHPAIGSQDRPTGGVRRIAEGIPPKDDVDLQLRSLFNLALGRFIRFYIGSTNRNVNHAQLGAAVHTHCIRYEFDHKWNDSMHGFGELLLRVRIPLLELDPDG